MWYNADEEGARPHGRVTGAIGALRDGTIFRNNFKLICLVQSRLQK
jgi:hypothetical protein